jgi:hypothetical protein
MLVGLTGNNNNVELLKGVLSKENYDKLNENYLYKKEPNINERSPYWCDNWTFKVEKLEDGRAYMLDTHFNSYSSHHIRVTDDNVNEFEVVFDFREVINISDSVVDEYEEKDLYCVATNSRGWSCGKLYWIKKGVQKSLQLQINKQKNKIEKIRDKLKWAEQELERLLEKQ